MNSIWMKVLIGSVLGLASMATRAEQTVVLDYRVQPNQHQRVTTTSEGNMRMKLDFAANSTLTGPARSTQTQFLTAMTQTAVVKTSELRSDGSLEMVVDHGAQRGVMRTPGAPDTELPTNLAGIVMKGVIEKSGAVRASSLKVEGGEPKLREALEKTAGATLVAFIGLPPLTLRTSSSTPYQLTMQVPVPQAGVMNAKISCDMRLLDLVQSIANIGMDCTIGLDTQNSQIPVVATGKGKGAMRYDTAQKVLLLSDMDLDMRFNVDSPELKIEFELTNKMRMAVESLPSR
jgi:hypothetical protein